MTGAGSGNGKHTTLVLRREGYPVVLAGRREEPLKRTTAEADMVYWRLRPSEVEHLFGS